MPTKIELDQQIAALQQQQEELFKAAPEPRAGQVYCRADQYFLLVSKNVSYLALISCSGNENICSNDREDVRKRLFWEGYILLKEADQAGTSQLQEKYVELSESFEKLAVFIKDELPIGYVGLHEHVATMRRVLNEIGHSIVSPLPG